MRLNHTFAALSVAAVVVFTVTACGGPKSAAVIKVEKGLDMMKAGVEANPKDCAKMASAIKEPVGDVVSGMKEVKASGEKLPASTKLQLAGMATTIQKMGPCSKTPEMSALMTSVISSATAQ